MQSTKTCFWTYTITYFFLLCKQYIKFYWFFIYTVFQITRMLKNDCLRLSQLSIPVSLLGHISWKTTGFCFCIASRKSVRKESSLSFDRSTSRKVCILVSREQCFKISLTSSVVTTLPLCISSQSRTTSSSSIKRSLFISISVLVSLAISKKREVGWFETTFVWIFATALYATTCRAYCGFKLQSTAEWSSLYSAYHS